MRKVGWEADREQGNVQREEVAPGVSALTRDAVSHTRAHRQEAEVRHLE